MASLLPHRPVLAANLEGETLLSNLIPSESKYAPRHRRSSKRQSASSKKHGHRGPRSVHQRPFLLSEFRLAQVWAIGDLWGFAQL